MATISGSVSIRTFLPQSLFGTVSMSVYIYDICLVSPLLLQHILANTLGLTRLLAQGRRDTARKRVHVKHHVKESFWNHALLMGKDSQASCTCNRIQRQKKGPITGVGFPVWAGLLSRRWHRSLSLWVEFSSSSGPFSIPRNCVQWRNSKT